MNGCFHLKLNTQDFPAGNYRIDCYDGNRKFNTYPSSYNVPANGSIQLDCWIGADGRDISAEIIGWGRTGTTRW